MIEDYINSEVDLDSIRVGDNLKSNRSQSRHGRKAINVMTSNEKLRSLDINNRSPTTTSYRQDNN